MKKVICSAVCILFLSSVFAQEKFPVPTRTSEQKIVSVKSELYAFIKAGLNFAKSQGVTPFNYGTYIGNLYAGSWNPEIGFDVWLKAVIQTWESLKTDQEGPIVITENADGSVVMDFPVNAIKKYFISGTYNVTFEEVVDFFSGVLNPIAIKYNSTVTLITTETYLSFKFKKN